MIGKKAKQKKTLERRDEVTTFCLTVNEKRHTTKKKITGQRHHTSNIRKQSLRTAIYSNPLTQCEECHADRRAVLNCKEKIFSQKSKEACSLTGRAPSQLKLFTAFVSAQKMLKYLNYTVTFSLWHTKAEDKIKNQWLTESS